MSEGGREECVVGVPNHQAALTLHFLLHGIHHLIPMDHDRLVMPPVLMALLCFGPWVLINGLFGMAICSAVFSGALIGYILYDLGHYYSHHGTPKFSFLRFMKTYHLEHHYGDYNHPLLWCFKSFLGLCLWN